MKTKTTAQTALDAITTEFPGEAISVGEVIPNKDGVFYFFRVAGTSYSVDDFDFDVRIESPSARRF